MGWREAAVTAFTVAEVATSIVSGPAPLAKQAEDWHQHRHEQKSAQEINRATTRPA